MILGLTVTLFASIFIFVGSFPQPPAQNVNQFQASLVYGSSNTKIDGVSIKHLTGPSVPGTDHVYLESATTTTNWQFSISGGVPVYWGLTTNSSSQSWSFGQYWNTTFSKPITTPDNITILIASTQQLLFSTVVPGATLTTPPAFLSAGTVPSTLTTSESFEIYASIGGTTTGLAVKVNLAGIPGLSGNVSMTYQSSTGLYVYTASAGASTKGTWYAVLYAQNSAGQLSSESVSVVVSSGSTSTGSVSVSVGMSPPPPSVTSQASSVFFWGTVTYTGSSTGLVYVNFTVLQKVYSGTHAKSVKTTIAGQSAVSITGPSSVSVYSNPSSDYSQWWLENATDIVYGNATVTNGIGKASGTIGFTVPNQDAGITYFSTSTTTPYSSTEKTFSHSCGSSHNCPYLYYSVWENWSGGPALTFKGVMTVNASCTSCSTTYTIASTALTTTTSPVSVDPVGSATRWTVPANGQHSGQVFVLHLWLQIYDGTTLIGYEADSVTITLS